MAAGYRKIKYLILPLVLLAAAIVFCAVVYGAGEASTMTVKVKNSILTPADKITRTVWNDSTGKYSSVSFYNVYDKDNITLTVKTGKNTVTLSGEGISRYCADNNLSFTVIDGQREAAWKSGKHTVTYKLGNMSADAEYTVSSGYVKSVAVTPMYSIAPVINTAGYTSLYTDSTGAVKSRYIYDLSLYDYYITVTLMNGDVVKCTNHNLYEKTGYNAVFTQPDGVLKAGKTYTAKCSVGGVSGSFNFTVRENDIRNIKLYFLYNSGNLKFRENGYFTKNSEGKTFYKFVYNRGDMRADVTYKDGSVRTYALGALCAALDSEFIIEDNQDKEPYSGGNRNIPCSIRGIPCSLPIWIDYSSVSYLKAKATVKNGYPAITLSWDYVPCEGYYICQYKNGRYERIADIKSSLQTSYTVEKLIDEGNYKFTVQAYDEGGSITTDVCSASANIVNPYNIGGFKAKAVSDSEIKLSWSKNNLVKGYTVEQLINNKWAVIGRIDDIAVTSFNVKKLKAATAYDFRICSVALKDGKEINSGYTNTSGITRPKTVSGINKTSDSGSITLSWNKNTTATHYIIDRYKSGKWVRVKLIEGNSNVKFTLTGLSPATEYKFRMQSYNKDIDLKSEFTEFTAFTAPSEVKGFKVSAKGSNSLTLSWEKNNGATGYIIEQYKGSKWVRIAKLTSKSETSYKVTGLSGSTRYVFRIKCYRNISGGAVKSRYTDKLVSYTKPSVVQGFTATTVSKSEIQLGWSKNESATGYIIERYNGTKWERIVKINSNYVTGYRVHGLTAGTKYTFRIQSYKTYNNGGALKSAYTEKLSAYTRPADMSGFKAIGRTDSAVRLSWNENKSVTGYIIQQYKDGKWVRIAKITDRAVNNYRVKGLLPSERYAFRIQGYKNYKGGAVKTPYTQKLVVYTNPKNVSNIKAVGKSDSEIRIKWQVNESATGYILQQYKSGKWVRIAKLKGNTVNSFTVKGLSPATAYMFRIQAYKTIGKGALKSGYTEVASASLPREVTGIRTSIKNGKVNLSWDKNPTASRFIIDAYIREKWVRMKLTSENNASIAISELSGAKFCQFRIQAYNIVGGIEVKSAGRIIGIYL